MLEAAKKHIKAVPGLKRVSLWGMRVLLPFIQLANLRAIPRYINLVSDWRKFRMAGGSAAILDFFPCLFDNTATSGIDTHYFYQAIWAFGRIMKSGAKHHVDVGSSVAYVGMLTTITDVTFVDIRPLELPLSRYHGLQGSIVALPFEDNSVSSFSSLHVIEHIGLGRYGDPIDPKGSDRACKEVTRILEPGGKAYISVPIGRSRVQFNGQRVFEIKQVLTMFDGLQLAELSIVDAAGAFKENVSPDEVDLCEVGSGLDFGLGMFVFEKTHSKR